jgi:hypothetical protein
MKYFLFLLVFLLFACHPISLFAQIYEGEKGDVNNDGTVNILDALTVVNHILEINLLDDQGFWRADCSSPLGKCSGDDVVNVLDVLKIVNLVLEIDLCPKVADSVFVADAKSGLKLEEIDSTTFTYSFQDTVPPLSPGDVLIDTVGGGHLRKVGTITIQGNNLIVETEDAALTDAIESIDTTIELIFGSKNKRKGEFELIQAADGVTVSENRLDFSRTIYEGDVYNAHVKVGAEGYIALDTWLDLALKTNWFRVEEFHAIAGEVEFSL